MDRIPFLGETLERLDLDADVPADGPLPPATARRVVAALNAEGPPEGRQPLPGELLALSVLHEAAHLAILAAARRRPASAIEAALPAVRKCGRPAPDDDPAAEVRATRSRASRRAAAPASRTSSSSTSRTTTPPPNRSGRSSTTAGSRRTASPRRSGRSSATRHRSRWIRTGPAAAPRSSSSCASRPAQSPDSLAGQLRYVRDHWGWLLGADLDRLPPASTSRSASWPRRSRRSTAVRWRRGGGGGRRGAGVLRRRGRARARSPRTRDWMPRLVLLAKSTYVWLDQLSRRVRPRDPDPRRDPRRGARSIARLGITGLWLIGLWQRSRASERIKRWRGNTDAVASAYSLDDYRIADDLGGEDALGGSATGPGGTGSGSRATWSRTTWASTRAGSSSIPERFIQLAEPPFPAYSFNGPDLSPTTRASRSGSRTTTGTTAMRPSSSSGATRATGERALHLPRQRRDELPLERHGPARLPPGRRPRGR